MLYIYTSEENQKRTVQVYTRCRTQLLSVVGVACGEGSSETELGNHDVYQIPQEPPLDFSLDAPNAASI